MLVAAAVAAARKKCATAMIFPSNWAAKAELWRIYAARCHKGAATAILWAALNATPTAL